jgi:tetratricopeptide (TPR) repeat protein
MEKEDQAPESVESAGPVTAPKSIPELEALKAYFFERGWRWTVVIVLAILILGGYQMFRMNQRAQIERASAMLMSASNLTTLQDIIKQYPTTPSAPIALLLLARSQFDSGNYALADGAYADFQMRYPTHFMAITAQLGRFHCLEAMGQVEGALDGYAEFVRNNSSHFLAPLALLGKARALTILGRYGEARIDYENFIASHPDSQWSREAESALSLLDRSRPSPPVTPVSAETPVTPVPAEAPDKT